MLRVLRQSPGPSHGALARFVVDGALAPGETTFGSVRRLRGGRCLRLSESGWEERVLRRIDYRRPVVSRREDAAQAVREAVEAAVDRSLDPPGAPAGVLLSGGVDSGSVAAVAASSGVSLPAYSAVFPDHPSTDESALIETVTSELGISSSRIAFFGGGMIRALLDYVEAWGVPSVSPNLSFQLPLLDRAARDGRRILLDGQGGDELFGGSPFLIADRILRGRLVAARRFARSCGGFDALREYGLKGALPRSAHRLRRRFRPTAQPLLTTAAADAYRESEDAWRWKERRGPRWWAFAADLVTSRRERSGAHDFLRHKFALRGIEGRHPFLADLQLIELVLQLPPEHALTGPLDRPLLREALEDVLPEAVRSRPDKAYFDALFLGGLEAEWEAVERLLGKDAEIRAIVRHDVLERNVLGGAPRTRGPAWAWQTWRLLSAEVFLRMQADPGFPARAREAWNLRAPRYSAQG